MMTATYSPEDNKLRLYSATRLDKETYARVRAAGFIYAPKQELFVAPMCEGQSVPYDLEDASLEKPVPAPKKPSRPPFALIPRHISETVDFLLASRPKRKTKGGRKPWNQQPEGK